MATEKTPFKRQLAAGKSEGLFERRRIVGTVPLSKLVAKHINRTTFTEAEAVSVAENLKGCFLTSGHRYPIGTIYETAAFKKKDGEYEIDIKAQVNPAVAHGVAVGENAAAEFVMKLIKDLDSKRLNLSIGLSSSSPKSEHPFPFDVALVEVPADDAVRIHSIAAYGNSDTLPPYEIAAFSFNVVEDESPAYTAQEPQAEQMQVDGKATDSAAAPMEGVQAAPVAVPETPVAPPQSAPLPAAVADPAPTPAAPAPAPSDVPAPSSAPLATEAAAPPAAAPSEPQAAPAPVVSSTPTPDRIPLMSPFAPTSATGQGDRVLLQAPAPTPSPPAAAPPVALAPSAAAAPPPPPTPAPALAAPAAATTAPVPAPVVSAPVAPAAAAPSPPVPAPTAPVAAPAPPAPVAETLKNLQAHAPVATAVPAPLVSAPQPRAPSVLVAAAARPAARPLYKMDGADAIPPLDGAAEPLDPISPETSALMKELIEGGTPKSMVDTVRTLPGDGHRQKMLMALKKQAEDDRIFKEDRTKQLEEVLAASDYTAAAKESLKEMALNGNNPKKWEGTYKAHKDRLDLRAKVENAEKERTEALSKKETEIKAQYADQLSAAARQAEEVKTQNASLLKMQDEMQAYWQRMRTEVEARGLRMPPMPQTAAGTTAPATTTDSVGAKRPATEPPAAAAPPPAPEERKAIAAFGADQSQSAAPEEQGALGRAKYLISAFGSSGTLPRAFEHPDDAIAIVLAAYGADKRPALEKALIQYTTVGFGSGPNPEDRLLLPRAFAAFGAVVQRITSDPVYHRQVYEDAYEYNEAGMAYTHPTVLQRAQEVAAARKNNQPTPPLDMNKVGKFNHVPPEVYTEDKAREMGVLDMWAEPVRPMQYAF